MQNSFRDRPLNINAKGESKRIFAKQPQGKWYTRRSIVGYALLAFLVLAPFIKIGENPLMLLDVAHRRFSLFGQLFYAQDTYILAFIMAVTVVCVVLFTVVFGRLFCGWACPQTLFLELIFRRIEFLIEGNKRGGSKKGKIPTYKKVVKYIIFMLVSVFFTNAFLNWFVGPERLFEIITSPISENRMGFVFMIGISTFYFFIYAYFRQQVCTMFCPYGRMQGVLIDSQTISVIYDFKRGEPRGAITQGDCIDCKQCIAVCPTGIDIKNGTQLECVNCTACIDECNIVMNRMGKPQNLIRYDSYQGVESGNKKIFTPRTIGYSIVLLLLLSVLGFLIGTRSVIDASVMRLPGTMYQEYSADTLSNMYNVKVVNKSEIAREISVRLLSPKNGTIQLINPKHHLNASGVYDNVLMIKLPKDIVTKKSIPIQVGIFDGELLLDNYSSNFVGPNVQ